MRRDLYKRRVEASRIFVCQRQQGKTQCSCSIPTDCGSVRLQFALIIRLHMNRRSSTCKHCILFDYCTQRKLHFHILSRISVCETNGFFTFPIQSRIYISFSSLYLGFIETAEFVNSLFRSRGFFVSTRIIHILEESHELYHLCLYTES